MSFTELERELLEACKFALVNLEYCRDNHKSDERDSQVLNTMINQLEQAISLAENNT